jgi:hypothetical protein
VSWPPALLRYTSLSDCLASSGTEPMSTDRKRADRGPDDWVGFE